MRKVLIANRGEIAVRVARACRDAGLTSVAVYAEPDLHALHVRTADEAYALGGTTPGDSYLRIDKVLKALADSGADAVHPGYGFLSENAEFAQAVIDAGATWIGPSPEAIAALGDKTTARHIALKIGAPLAPGTADPVKGVDEVLAFVDEYGLPVAIKAAFGGGGRGLKIARTKDEVPELYESAVREAVAAFGRGECFVERYLDKPRHVETQVLADSHGNVVVVSTRDCSLQRRYQKVVEEAPAPFLSAEQTAQLYDASKKIILEAGYVGAGTCEFLVAQDGLISFLEVNTRLQVEHPVTEEVTGIDLVREQFRIADGEALGFDDPAPRGHSFEFRINGEDPGRGFLPAPGTVTSFVAPAGPGVRVDSGVELGRRRRRRLRLAAGQAHRHRRHPRAGPAAGRPRARRDAGRGHGHAAALPPRGGPRPGLHQRARSRCTTAGSRPSSTTTCRPSPAARPTRPSRPSGRPSSSRSAASGSRSSCPRASAPPPPRPAPPRRRPSPQALGGRSGGSAPSGDTPHQPHAGHHRQGRGRGRRHRRGRRPRRRPRGDEDGAAAQRAQGRHRHAR